MTMSNEEFRELLADFERVYDPFDTYETDPITSIYEDDTNSSIVQPRWTSGTINISGEYVDSGSHELITARACTILLNDKGFWSETEAAYILLALSISLASLLPDRELNLGALDLFKGHFYDPDTGKNWAGGTKNTAKKNAQKFFDNAIEEYGENGQSEDFIKHIGRMLHYVQDACQPHHAANIKVGENDNVHGEFETFADTNLTSYINQLTTISNYTYENTLNYSVEEIVHDAAHTAKDFSIYVDDINDQSEWARVAGSTTRNAVRETAKILYKLSNSLSLPLIQYD